MRVLITGATGFIASQIVSDLYAAGHQVVCCVRNVEQARQRFWYAEVVSCNFNLDITPEVWLPRLKGIDAVVNCVGVLQGGFQQSIKNIHQETPIALFKACQESGVKRVIQISALGAGEVDVDFSKTKNKADEYLLGLKDLSSLVIRPSFVYSAGSYGGSSLFRGMAALPGVIPIVNNGKQMMQPIFLPELGRAVVQYVENPETSGIIDAVGAERISLKEIIAKLRTWLGFSKAVFVSIPLQFVKLFGKFGDWMQRSPVNSTTVKMMQVDNVSDSEKFSSSMPFKVRGFSEVLASMPSSTQDRWHAKLYFLRILLRMSLVFLWFFSGAMGLLNPSQGNSILLQLGFPEGLLDVARIGLSLMDISIAVAILARWKIRLLGYLQFLIVLAYTVVLTIGIPDLWMGTVKKHTDISYYYDMVSNRG